MDLELVKTVLEIVVILITYAEYAPLFIFFVLITIAWSVFNRKENS